MYQRISMGAVVAMLSLVLPTAGLAYGRADDPQAMLTTTTVSAKVAATPDRFAKRRTGGLRSHQVTVQTLETLKKARKEKGGK